MCVCVCGFLPSRRVELRASEPTARSNNGFTRPQGELAKRQLARANELDDPERVINREIRLKAIMLDKHAPMFALERCGLLRDPQACRRWEFVTFLIPSPFHSVRPTIPFPHHICSTCLPWRCIRHMELKVVTSACGRPAARPATAGPTAACRGERATPKDRRVASSQLEGEESRGRSRVVAAGLGEPLPLGRRDGRGAPPRRGRLPAPLERADPPGVRREISNVARGAHTEFAPLNREEP